MKGPTLPIEKRDAEAQGPGQAHFALLLDPNKGLRAPIPPGASLWIVEDKNDMSKIFPLTLKKVSHKEIRFEMSDGSGGVTEYRYVLASAKPLNKEALSRLVKQANSGAKVQR